MIVLEATWAELEGGPDEHHRRAGRAPSQITFDWVNRDSGESHRGRIAPATRATLRGWLSELPRVEGAFAVEGCTGWRFVVEELQAAGLAAHLAEPAETSSLRGPKRRAKTDRTDARRRRELLEQGRLPWSWIPPGWVLDLRTTVRLGKTLVDQRTAWQQRIHAVLFHHGLPRPTQELLSPAPAPGWSRWRCRRPAARPWPLRWARSTTWTPSWTRSTVGCGPGSPPAGLPGADDRPLWDRGDHRPDHPGELGDVRRFGGGDQVVRATGLDITVYASDGKRSPGRLSRQGPEVLRWALFEAAKAAARPSLPDYAYYQQVKARQGGNRATLAVARKLVRRVRHTLVRWATPPSPRRRPCPVRGGLTVAGACPPTGKQMCRGQRPPAPAATAGPWTAPRPRGRAPPGHPSVSLSPDPGGSAHPDKAGRPHAHADHHHRGEG
jgi:transposase